ncbi:MAG: flippase [Lachnospiraceae bacterium]|nr:flippase [Lachnospiraceae bacterium]
MNPLRGIGVNGRIVVRNSIYSMLGSVLGQFVALLSSLAMGRLLGVGGLGSYTFAMTFSGLVFLFLNLGLSGIFQRNISQDRTSAEKNYANALAIRFLFSIPMSLCIGTVCVFAMHRQDDLWILLLSCIYTGFTGIFGLAADGITAVEKFRVTFLFGMCQKILCFLTTFIALYVTKSMLVMLLFHDIIFFILIIVELIYVNKSLCKIHLEIDFPFCKKMLKEAFPAIFGAAAEFLSLKSDTLILTLMLGEVATGLYSVSSNIYIAASFVPLAMAKAATPTFNRMIANKEKVDNLVRRTFQMMALSSIVLIIGIFVFARFGIVLLWGKDFEGASVSLRILSISLLCMPANRFLGEMLVGLKQQALVAKCSVTGAIFNIVANIILVPVMGLNAVAITTVVTECLVMLMEGYFYKRIQTCSIG